MTTTRLATTGADRSSRAWAVIEFLSYFLCSVVALGVDTALYWLALRVGIVYRGAAVVGFIGGVATAYALSVQWVFRRRTVADPKLEFLIFLGIGLAGLGLTEILLWIEIDAFHLGPMMAKLFAAVGVFLFNFTARKFMLFSRRRLAPKVPS